MCVHVCACCAHKPPQPQLMTTPNNDHCSERTLDQQPPRVSVLPTDIGSNDGIVSSIIHVHVPDDQLTLSDSDPGAVGEDLAVPHELHCWFGHPRDRNGDSGRSSGHHHYGRGNLVDHRGFWRGGWISYNSLPTTVYMLTYSVKHFCCYGNNYLPFTIQKGQSLKQNMM